MRERVIDKERQRGRQIKTDIHLRDRARKRVIERERDK